MTSSHDLDLLIIEDDEQVARMAKRALKRSWKNIYVAHSCEEGLELLDTISLDVILSDWDCPNEGDGARIVQNAHLPVVIYTGNEHVKNICKAVTVLSKPTDINDITLALFDAWEKFPIG